MFLFGQKNMGWIQLLVELVEWFYCFLVGQIQLIVEYSVRVLRYTSVLLLRQNRTDQIQPMVESDIGLLLFVSWKYTLIQPGVECVADIVEIIL